MATADDLNHSLPWQPTLEKLHDFSSRLLLAIHGIAAADLARPEKESAWSILNVIAHLGDLELMTATRIRLVVAQETPRLPGFDQEQFVERVHAHDTLAELLEQFGSLRRANLAFVDKLSDFERPLAAVGWRDFPSTGR